MVIRVRIGAPSKKEAYAVSKSLVEKRLVAGTMIYKGDCQYWWNDKIEQNEYYNIGGMSIAKHKRAIIELVKQTISDECPIVCFSDVDGNQEMIDWVHENVS